MLCLRRLEQDRLHQMNTFDEILGLLNTKSSYVRTRGFVLCCAQARWDEGGKLQKALPTMLALLHDDKPIVVRQCLAALHEVVLYRSELREAIKAELGAIDFSRHKESMSPLIKKDVEELLNLID
jgi:hypothetical protein